MDERLHEATIASIAQSIRELGEMLVVADQHPDYRARMLEVERLSGRLVMQQQALSVVLRREWLRCAA